MMKRAIFAYYIEDVPVVVRQDCKDEGQFEYHLNLHLQEATSNVIVSKSCSRTKRQIKAELKRLKEDAKEKSDQLKEV